MGQMHIATIAGIMAFKRLVRNNDSVIDLTEDDNISIDVTCSSEEESNECDSVLSSIDAIGVYIRSRRREVPISSDADEWHDIRWYGQSHVDVAKYSEIYEITPRHRKDKIFQSNQIIAGVTKRGKRNRIPSRFKIAELLASTVPTELDLKNYHRFDYTDKWTFVDYRAVRYFDEHPNAESYTPPASIYNRHPIEYVPLRKLPTRRKMQVSNKSLCVTCRVMECGYANVTLPVRVMCEVCAKITIYTGPHLWKWSPWH